MRRPWCSSLSGSLIPWAFSHPPSPLSSSCLSSPDFEPKAIQPEDRVVHITSPTKFAEDSPCRNETELTEACKYEALEYFLTQVSKPEARHPENAAASPCCPAQIPIPPLKLKATFVMHAGDWDRPACKAC
jgi:hypothetical protein